MALKVVQCYGRKMMKESKQVNKSNKLCATAIKHNQ